MRVHQCLVFGGCLAASLLLSACATPYRPLKRQSGYYDQQLGAEEFEVTFLGNGNSTYDRALDLALLRAAEITLARQAKSFTVSDVVNLSSTRKYQTAPQYFWTASPYLSRGQVVPSADEPVAGLGQSFRMVAPAQERIFYRPGVRLKINLSPTAAGGSAYDPAKVRSRIRTKYGLD